MPSELSPALEDVRAELQAASSRARELVSRLPREWVGRRPDATSWSVAECLAHLTLTTDAYVAAIREAIADGRGRNLPSPRPRFRLDLVARMLAWWLEPPYRQKSQTGAAFVPAVGDPAEALPDFLERQEQLFELLKEANGLAIDRLRIASLFSRRVRYSVYSAFRLIAIHQRRHLWQAEQVALSLIAGNQGRG